MTGAPTAEHEMQPHVLFAILDWGLGHATRTWPLIVAARNLGARVTIASRGAAGQWLDARMAEWDRANGVEGQPQWNRVEKPGVTIRYGRGWSTLPRIALQMPGFIRSIAHERRWTTAYAAEHGVTHVFSDNCYGARGALAGVNNVFMSHQLQPPVPPIARAAARGLVRRYARRFDAVWVPDTALRNLAGGLAESVSSPTRYVGPLSRFQVMSGAAPTEEANDSAAAPVLLGLVSGPEPQRTDMEQALRACFLRDGRPALLLAGKPGGGEHREGNVLTVHDADDGRFRRAILAAECIICRSGYSTLLDLVTLGRKAVLIPTIGQPEQEGLADEWRRKHGWTTLRLEDLRTYRPGPMTGQTVSAEAPGPLAEMEHWLSTERHGNPDL